MDRLPTVGRALAPGAAGRGAIRARGLVLALLAVGAPACEEKPGAEPPARVNAVPAAPVSDNAARGFCDKSYPADQAPAFRPPQLEGELPAAAGWRWVNVWATWCKPCVEELPRLARWRARLAGRVTIQLVSVDEDEGAIVSFRRAHPGTPPSARIADPEAVPAWLRTLGLDEQAAVPLHILVDPGGRTRCARSGTVAEHDLPIIERMLAD